DGSTAGEGALAAVAPWARASGAEIHLLTILKPTRIHDTSARDFVSSVPGGGGVQGEFAPVSTVVRYRTIEDRTQAMARAREEAEDYLRAMAGRYLHGMQVDIAIQWDDHAAEAIADFAETVSADLIVMGTHGRTGLSHALVGSVAEDTIRRATVPVTVIRQGVAVRGEVLEDSAGTGPQEIRGGTVGKERLLSFLRQNKVPYTLRHHPPAISAGDLAASENVPADMVAKSVVVGAHGEYAVAVVPATCRLNLERLEALTGREDLRLVDEAELAIVFPDCEVGAVHPFGNLYQIPVYVDCALAEARNLAFHAGTHRDAVYMTYTDFVRVVDPIVGDIRQET
ncbi:MAG TPA: YbaK/EbsC family protein, partial [Dehalococcoidia bacterium]|nr:YbaK/EbsC family protein [Dehalococcoidia bacterium]